MATDLPNPAQTLPRRGSVRQVRVRYRATVHIVVTNEWLYPAWNRLVTPNLVEPRLHSRKVCHDVGLGFT